MSEVKRIPPKAWSCLAELGHEHPDLIVLTVTCPQLQRLASSKAFPDRHKLVELLKQT